MSLPHEFQATKQGSVMQYYKIYNKPRDAWWRQDCMGYTDEANAGFFPEASTAVADARERHDEDVLIAYEPSTLQLLLRELTASCR